MVTMKATIPAVFFTPLSVRAPPRALNGSCKKWKGSAYSRAAIKVPNTFTAMRVYQSFPRRSIVSLDWLRHLSCFPGTPASTMSNEHPPVNERHPVRGRDTNRERLYESLERYRDIVPGDWRDFAAAVRAPQPVTVWRNAPRIGDEHFRSWMEEYEGIDAAPAPWDPRLYRLGQGSPDQAKSPSERLKPGNLLAFGAGLYHVQEEAAAVPAALLAAALGADLVGARVLDMCAAPGNKSAQLAQMVGLDGTIIANDVNERRFQGGIPTWERLGLANIAATVYDGRNFPHVGPVFDAVLVDVPCTGEGTCRRNPGALRPTSSAFKERLYETQAALLRRAVELCRTRRHHFVLHLHLCAGGE